MQRYIGIAVLAPRIMLFGILWGIIWSLLVGFFAVTEPEELTRRQAQAVQTGRWLRRLFQMFLGPGAARGRRFLLLLLAINGLLLACFASKGNPFLEPSVGAPEWFFRLAIGLACYGTFILGPLALILRRWGRRWIRSVMHLRAWLLAVSATWLLVASLVLGIVCDCGLNNYADPLLTLSPLTGILVLLNNAPGPGPLIILGLGLASLLVLAANARPRDATRNLQADQVGRQDGG